MRVALAEDNLVYRNGLVRLLEATGARVVHEAGTGGALLAHLEATAAAGGELPDVVMLDIRMGGRDDDGLVAAERIARDHPGTGVLLISAHVDARYARRLFEGGSAGRGYLLKDGLDSVAELAEALDRVRRGRTYTDPRVVDELVRREGREQLAGRLSPREREVLALLAQGASNAAIARATRSTTKAVESAVTGLYAKLGVPDTPDYNRRVLVALSWLDGAGPGQSA